MRTRRRRVSVMFQVRRPPITLPWGRDRTPADSREAKKGTDFCVSFFVHQTRCPIFTRLSKGEEECRLAERGMDGPRGISGKISSTRELDILRYTTIGKVSYSGRSRDVCVHTR